MKFPFRAGCTQDYVCFRFPEKGNTIHCFQHYDYAQLTNLKFSKYNFAPIFNA
jgi:hypothetical protein